jgi:hypothetical protein
MTIAPEKTKLEAVRIGFVEKILTGIFQTVKMDFENI